MRQIEIADPQQFFRLKQAIAETQTRYGMDVMQAQWQLQEAHMIDSESVYSIAFTTVDNRLLSGLAIDVHGRFMIYLDFLSMWSLTQERIKAEFDYHEKKWPHAIGL